jgi:hypothetical protein
MFVDTLGHSLEPKNGLDWIDFLVQVKQNVFLVVFREILIS